MPNVLGSIIIPGASSGTWLTQEGAFKNSKFQGTMKAQQEEGIGDVFIDFQASLSNSIYGFSQRVQPKSAQLLIIIKV